MTEEVQNLEKAIQDRKQAQHFAEELATGLEEIAALALSKANEIRRKAGLIQETEEDSSQLGEGKTRRDFEAMSQQDFEDLKQKAAGVRVDRPIQGRDQRPSF